MPPVPHSMNHVAYPTFDMAATYRFYAGLLGCPLVGSIRKDAVPSTGEATPFLHTFFALGSGECLAFFELEGLQRRTGDDGIPSWVRHIALNVESYGELLAMKHRLEEHDVEVVGVVDHDGTWSSIYCYDPNGVRIEFTYQSRELGEADQAEGMRLLQQWVRERGQSMTGIPA